MIIRFARLLVFCHFARLQDFPFCSAFSFWPFCPAACFSICRLGVWARRIWLVFFSLDFITVLYWPSSTLLWQAIPKSTQEKGVKASLTTKVKVDLSACGPLCEACLCFPTHCWNWYLRHEFYKTCYFFGMHVRRIRLIPKIIRVNFIDTVFFTVTCFVLEVCLFWHVLPFFSGHCVFFCMGYLFLLPFWHVLPFALFFWCPAACISL